MKTNKKINLAQLDGELNGQGLNATLDDDKNIIDVSLCENNKASEAELKSAIEAHVAIDEMAIYTAARAALLAKLGITADEAKLLLS